MVHVFRPLSEYDHNIQPQVVEVCEGALSSAKLNNLQDWGM